MKADKTVILRTYLIYSLLVIVMTMILTKTVLIIHDGRENIFSSKSEKIEQRVASTLPRRGEILDTKASPLVTSVSYYDVYMDPTTVRKKIWDEEINGLCKGLAELFPEKTAKEYEQLLREARATNRRYVLIQKGVTNETRRKLRQLPIFKHGRFKGGIIDNKATIERKRPHDELFRRTLGYVKINENDTLRVGLEGAYDYYLAGQPGKILEQRISNAWKPTGTVIREAIEGYDLITTIDKDIQEVAHTELENQLKTKGGRYGCAIVMDVKTGFIKAMANLQKGNDGEYYESFNHAIATREVPGSTFKLASLMAALEDKKVSIYDTVNAVGRYEFFGKYLNDSKKYGYGKITLKEAFEVSSNIISKVIYEHYHKEPQRFIDRIHSFGLTEKLNVPIAGESTPNFSKPGSPEWWGGSLAWMSIGYEFQLTPLQMLSFYNAVANNGKYMQPQFVSEVRQGRKTVKTFEPVVMREKICSQPTLDLLKSCLEGVMINGTGKNLKSTFFTTAGKTGTAQIANHNLGYGKEGEKKHIASFVGYFPAEDPIYSCIVVIAAPTDDIYGASVSGTVFSAIANKVYATSLEYHKAINEKQEIASIPITHSGYRYDLNTVLNQFNIKRTFERQTDADAGEWVNTFAQEKAIHVKGQKIIPEKVPNVVGMGLKDALYLLEKAGLRVKTTGYGTVKKQSIPAGQEAIPGGRIELTLAQQ